MMLDFAAQFDRQMAKLNADDAAAKAKNNIVGRYVTHSVADGYAYYKIVRVTKTTAVLEWQDIGDGYVVAGWGKKPSVKLSVVLGFLQQRDRQQAFFSKMDDWWKHQTVGAIVHYSNGFGQYVRGVIVVENGEKKMRPTALVGNWKSYDLVTRRVDGSINYGYHAKKIIDGEAMHPSASNMVENPDFRLSGQHPSTLPIIDLTPPTMSPQAQKLADLQVLRQAVMAALQNVEITNDTEASLIEMTKALSAARALLDNLSL